MITITHSGNFNKIERFLKSPLAVHTFNRYGQEGVRILSSATPKESGETASSWGYTIIFKKSNVKIVWTNSNIVDGVPIAILLQYGHGTRNGGYVQGRDYINPAMKPIFDRLATDMWKEVVR